MRRHLNTLYVTTEGAKLAREGETVLVRIEKQTRLQIPVLNLGGIVCFGRVFVTPALMGLCAARGVAITFMTTYGRFVARIVGPTTGNVLLRREQYRRTEEAGAALAIARAIVAAKIASSRAALLRAARDHPDEKESPDLRSAAQELERALVRLRAIESLDECRGLEGFAARRYFDCFNHLITQQKEDFEFRGRSRRPPLDRVNALLSFIYTLVVHDVRSGVESVGLDPNVGYLHQDRPGRPSLALDLMEEFRPWFADRLVCALINLRQITARDFREAESGAVLLEERGRKEVIVAYQKRKQDELTHPFLNERTTVGLLPHIQALLLARHLRGDLDGYPPFVWR